MSSDADVSGATLPPSRPAYSHWMREPVAYYWVLSRGRRSGCLWGSLRHAAAGFLLVPDASESELYAADVWEDRLSESHAAGMPAIEAVRRWRGAAEDPVGGAIPADEQEQRADGIQALHQVVAPGFPVPVGPSIQDGVFPDGTPADRSQGFGPLVSVAPSTYPEQASGPVRYLPVTVRDTVVGFVWASADGRAAGYLNRTAAGVAGVAGEVAAGLWRCAQARRTLRLRRILVPPPHVRQ